MGFDALARLSEEEGKCWAFGESRRVVPAEVAREVVSAIQAERDDLAARLAELEVQEPAAWMTAKRDMASLINFHDDDLPLFARPVPSEPVNARLLEALKRAKDSLVAFKFVPGHANCWESSDEENLTAVNSAIAAAEAQQERLLQDMHDAGREIDRVMAEAAPKAVRLTEAEVAAELNLFPHPSSLVLKITRAIETAVLRKNGIKVAE